MPSPWTTPVTQNPNTKILSADWNSYVRDNLGFLHDPPACRVYRTSEQAIPSGADTNLLFDQERFDTDTMHDLVSNTDRITINTPGKYLIFAHVLFQPTSIVTGEMSITLKMNGS